VNTNVPDQFLVTRRTAVAPGLDFETWETTGLNKFHSFVILSEGRRSAAVEGPAVAFAFDFFE
jgi:hypothetical protein